MAEEFDAEAVFDDDYLFFAGEKLDADAPAQVELLRAVVDIAPGAEVLDLCCGHGRMANRLAAAVPGVRVTGFDLTPAFLDRARADAAGLGVDVEYVRGDMRALPWTGRFDLAYCWFTAFGYFDDDTNRDVLRGVHDALRSGGRFVLELNHRDELMRRMVDAVVVEQGDDKIVDRHRFDPLTGRNHVRRLILRDGGQRERSYFTRLFTFTELRDWLLGAGFSTVQGYGPDAEPLTIRSTRMIVVAQR